MRNVPYFHPLRKYEKSAPLIKWKNMQFGKTSYSYYLFWTGNKNTPLEYLGHNNRFQKKGKKDEKLFQG